MKKQQPNLKVVFTLNPLNRGRSTKGLITILKGRVVVSQKTWTHHLKKAVEWKPSSAEAPIAGYIVYRKRLYLRLIDTNPPAYKALYYYTDSSSSQAFNYVNTYGAPLSDYIQEFLS